MKQYKIHGWIKYCVLFCLFCFLILQSSLYGAAASGTKIQLNESSLVLEKNQFYYMELQHAAGKVKWTSSDKRVAEVDASGKVTAKAEGACRITAAYKKKTYSCRVTVTEPEIELNKTRLALEERQTSVLKLQNASGKIKWISDNPSVASVTSSGKVTAKKAGTCKISAKHDGKKYICRITVSKRVVLNQTSVILLKGKSSKLTLKNAKETVTWKSSNPSIAAVSRNGTITAKKTGTCRITAVYKKKSYVCTVKVYNKNTEWMPQMLEKKYDTASNKGKIVLAGSSSIDYWSSASSAFAPYETVNVGIAGSRVEDWLELYSRLIVPYEPKAVVLYVGGNNLTGAINDLNGSQTAAKLCLLLKKLKSALPNTKIYYVSINPSEKYWHEWSEIKISNSKVKKFCSTQKNLYYINLAKHFLGADGLPVKAYYRTDKVHASEAGYALWAKYVAGKVKKDLS